MMVRQAHHLVQLELPFRWPDMVTPYERDVVARRLADLVKWCGQPVPARLLADHLGKSERMARVYLSRLERSGYVQRPRGQRSGWAIAAN